MRRPRLQVDLAVAASLFAAAIGMMSGVVGGLRAQTPPPAAQSGTAVILGCVARDGAPGVRGAQAGSAIFTMRDPRGDGTTFRLEGDPEALAWHVGHTLELRGAIAAGATAGSATARLPVFKIASVVYISPTCIYK